MKNVDTTTRRNFLAGSALGGAVLAMTSLAACGQSSGASVQSAEQASFTPVEQDANKVGVTIEESKLDYYKYYQRDMAAVPEEKTNILNAGPSSVKAVPFDQKTLFLTGDDGDYCQVGYGIMDDGTGFVCNETYMPGVTSDMLDWWFPWHSVGSDLRYKMWDPEDHYFARADNLKYVCDSSVPMREKTWGVNHYIIENIGLGPEYLKLCFKRPSDFGYEETLIGCDKCASMVCAIGDSAVAAAMTHKWYAHEDGVMFCSRFWVGMGVVDGQIVKTLPDGQSIPDIVPKCLFGHNIKEFANLAAILPEVYAQNKENF